MRITRKTCRSTYSPNHNLKVWIYFLSGQAKSLGGGRWLWIKSTHTMNLDSIQSHLHGIEPPLASYSGLYSFSPSTRGQECIWLVHLGRMNWECWNQFLPFLLGGRLTSEHKNSSLLHTTQAGQERRSALAQHCYHSHPEQEYGDFSGTDETFGL